MKKLGFTLAEILITLGIVGVVAALTAPALVQNAGSAQIGPKLAKAVSTFETANETYLTQMGMDTLASAGAFQGDSNDEYENYINNLAKYMKISVFDESAKDKKYKDLLKSYDGELSYTAAISQRTVRINISRCVSNGIFGLSKDGILYVIAMRNNAQGQSDRPPHMRFAGNILIDINGYSEPNRLGKDAFLFQAYADGSLRPVGANDWWAMAEDSVNDEINWDHGTTDICNADGVTTGVSCTGSIFENNLKVIYQ